MFYCPKCKSKVYLEIDIQSIPADFSPNILTNSINLVLCSIGNFMNIEIKGFKCPNCCIQLKQEDLLMRSQISDYIDKIDKFIIVSVKSKKEGEIDGKVILVIPPKVIHEKELEKFKENNPYKDDKYLIINRLQIISYTSPK
jgi:hypothetical protein